MFEYPTKNEFLMGVNKTNRKRYLFEGVEYLSKNGKEITEYVHSNWKCKTRY